MTTKTKTKTKRQGPWTPEAAGWAEQDDGSFAKPFDCYTAMRVDRHNGQWRYLHFEGGNPDLWGDDWIRGETRSHWTVRDACEAAEAKVMAIQADLTEARR